MTKKKEFITIELSMLEAYDRKLSELSTELFLVISKLNKFLGLNRNNFEEAKRILKAEKVSRK